MSQITMSQQSSETCAQKLKTLSDSTRLAVLELLMGQPMHVGEMKHQLGLEQSLLSHHLKILRQAGFVSSIRDGKSVLYQLSAQVRPTHNTKEINLGCCVLNFDEPIF